MIKIILGSILGLFLLVVAILACTLFGCFRKKTPAKKNVESELELMFPGQFQVLDSNRKMLDIMAQFKGEKQAVIGDKADPDVQFLLNWNKGATTVGFDSVTVIAAHEYAKKDVAEARALFKQLKDKGLEKFSVGSIEGSAYVQVYIEPSPAARMQVLETLKTVFDKAPRSLQNSVFIELLEPEDFHIRYQDIIPSTHWGKGGGVQGEQMILSLNFDLGTPMNVKDLARQWEINTGAKRLNTVLDDSHAAAKIWAAKNLPQPAFLSPINYVSYEVVESVEPAIRYGFAYYDKPLTKEEEQFTDKEPVGYVTGIYYFDQKVFTKLKRQKEF